MTNPGYQCINDYQDVESRNIFAIKQAEGMSEAEILAILGAKSRDNSRTPMQWSAASNAGFTSGTPWLNPVSYTHLLTMPSNLASTSALAGRSEALA